MPRQRAARRILPCATTTMRTSFEIFSEPSAATAGVPIVGALSA